MVDSGRGRRQRRREPGGLAGAASGALVGAARRGRRGRAGHPGLRRAAAAQHRPGHRLRGRWPTGGAAAARRRAASPACPAMPGGPRRRSAGRRDQPPARPRSARSASAAASSQETARRRAGRSSRGRQGRWRPRGTPVSGPSSGRHRRRRAPSRPPPRCRPATSAGTIRGLSRLQRGPPGRQGRRRTTAAAGELSRARAAEQVARQAHAAKEPRSRAAEAAVRRGEKALATAEAKPPSCAGKTPPQLDRDRTAAGGRRAAARRGYVSGQSVDGMVAAAGAGRRPVRAGPARRPVRVGGGGPGPVRLLRPDVGRLPVSAPATSTCPGSPATSTAPPGAGRSRNALLPGDLLFFASGSSWPTIHHVAMYIGGGKMVQAPDAPATSSRSPRSGGPGLLRRPPGLRRGPGARRPGLRPTPPTTTSRRRSPRTSRRRSRPPRPARSRPAPRRPASTATGRSRRPDSRPTPTPTGRPRQARRDLARAITRRPAPGTTSPPRPARRHRRPPRSSQPGHAGPAAAGRAPGSDRPAIRRDPSMALRLCRRGR